MKATEIQSGVTKHGTQFAALLLVAVIAALTFSCNQQPPQTQPKPADKSLLVGNWVRTDAPYRIQISELLDDGKMKAGYFNPKSINVSKAGWVNSGGVIQLYVEMRDTNYPGSNYTLTYIPERDLLAGNYFQAVEGTTFRVAFVRAK
jgi:hypothetical protein